MDDNPVALSSSLPLWLKLVAGALLVAAALASVRWAVRRPGGHRWIDTRRYTRRDVLIPALVAAVLVAALVAVALDVAFDGLLSRADLPVHDWFVRHQAGWLTPVVLVVTNVMSPFGTTVQAILIAAFVAARTRSWMPALLIFTGPALAGLGVRLVKLLAPRARPDVAQQLVITLEPSFPSGHVTGAVALYGCVLVVLFTGFLGPLGRRSRILLATGAAVLSIAVALTRLYLAVHWFTDVIAGGLLGGAVAVSTLAIYREVARRRLPVG